jgi:F-type H+-transporting ATPase subunit beta
MTVAAAVKVGKVVQVIGPVVDIEFEGGQLPDIYNAVRISGAVGGAGKPGSAEDAIDIIVEVEQHLGEKRVRTVAMKPTDGLQRGMTATDQGGPISMPVGPQTLAVC